MAKGLVIPTKPIASDIVLGEFNYIGNYGTPRQINLGATMGGLKIELARSIKEMKYDGSYGPTKGLRRHEKFDAKVTIESLCLKYNNTLEIEHCESDTTMENNDWAATGGTYAAETTIKNTQDQSAKATVANINEGIHAVFASAKDLTQFDNGETSTTSDYIGFAIYITTAELANLGSADIRIGLHMDAEGTETNYYSYDVAASALTADEWTTFRVLKSSFTENGTGDWSAVTGISFKLDAAPSGSTIFYVDSVDLIQNHTKSTIVPVQGGGMTYTDEGDYRKFVPNLEIIDDDYYENIVVYGYRFNGMPMLYYFENCLNDGNISLALAEKTEVVNSTQFTAHYNAATDIPFKIREYKVVI